MNYAIDIPGYALVRMGIPSRITEEQLADSGYTCRFAQHKELIKKELAERLLKDIEFDFQITPFGVTLIGRV